MQVLIARLSGVAEEVGAVLQRAAFSPNIKERADCSAAVFDADGQPAGPGRAHPGAPGVDAGIGGAPSSTGSVPALGPGEQAMVNDPYAGGTHLNDITLVAPCCGDDRLVGWVANRAHHADVGGAAPGSLPADATEIQQEGLRLPPLRLTDEVVAVILANSRTPDERAGDLDAQIGANRVGVERLAQFADAPFADVLAHGERRCRAALAALADGRWSATDVLDSTGPAPDQQRPATLRCTVTKSGEEITFDFTGTDAQRAGNTNAVEAVTVSAASFALRCVVDHTLPANAGTMAPVTVIAPEGTVVAARFPAAVGAGNVEVSQRVADVCLRALAEAFPDRVPAASQGTMNNLLIGSQGERSGRGAWVYYETIAGGQGGRPPRPDTAGDVPHPGMSGVHTGMTNTKNTPIEALERSYGAPGARAADLGQRGSGRRSRRGRDRARARTSRRRHGQPHHGASGAALPGGWRAARTARSGENWLLPGGDPRRCRAAGRQGDDLPAGRRRRAGPHPRWRRLGPTGLIGGAARFCGASPMAVPMPVPVPVDHLGRRPGDRCARYALASDQRRSTVVSARNRTESSGAHRRAASWRQSSTT